MPSPNVLKIVPDALKLGLEADSRRVSGSIPLKAWDWVICAACKVGEGIRFGCIDAIKAPTVPRHAPL
jgi:hypothetical protein